MKVLPIIIAIALTSTIACHQNNTSQKNRQTAELSDSLKIDSLTRLINKNKRNADLYAQRSKLHIDQGHLTEAIKDLVFANQIDSLNPEYYLHLSDFYLRMGKSEVVNSILLKGNKLIPDNKDILYRLGNLYFYIKDYKKSIQYLNKSLEVDRYYSKAYFSKGMVYKELENIKKATENFQFAVEREPDYYDAYIQLGLIFSEKNDSLALDYYDNALRLIPKSYEALYGKAMFYQQNKRLDEAQKTYRHILDSISIELPVIHFNTGYIDMFYYANYKNAIIHFDSALMYKPKYIEALNNKAYCYEKLGNKKRARENYKKVLEFSPNYDLAVKGLNRLDGKN